LVGVISRSVEAPALSFQSAMLMAMTTTSEATVTLEGGS
jgi:hypothetical protein